MTGSGDPSSLLRAAVADHRAGRLAAAEAGYRSVLDREPGLGAAWRNLGVVRAGAGDPAGALACFDRAVACDPRDPAAAFNRAGALLAAGRADEARTGYERAVALDPDLYDAHRALGFLWQAAGRRDRALDHFARTMDLRRGDGRTGIGAESLRGATRAKLAHDAAQMRHLAALGRSREPLEDRARVLEEVAAALGTGVAALSPGQLEALGEFYNTPWHLADAPEAAAGAVRRGLDAAAIEADFHAGAARTAWFDGLLSADALARLGSYLLESTIWFDFAHVDGFLATYLEDGLACPLVLQIADEVRAAFPGVIGGRRLAQAWAFKGLDEAGAIGLHADDGGISLNFWVTPDSANRSPGRGGMALYGAPPPGEPAGYDADAAGMRRFAKTHEDSRIVVPYRENRAVLFESRLVHGSDAPDFRAGYRNRRINVTMLFGEGPGGA